LRAEIERLIGQGTANDHYSWLRWLKQARDVLCGNCDQPLLKFGSP
jgi:hypothetical protein